ncbi:MAG: hypothetical protein COV07_02370 [Candidatus Vogelbacteria bacterium CG10_big_fil_rev_8_21_14_0_10_45_14]|uniref:MobA-like NTP transferase domain-containing protein n=1 Tax=Candidatus Vogelbacteria bacterium CG10_big_fil_rev_8_21_14_0_10_45_14 TaxID=1975042 RepID=A0A2H0RJY3_9BACT|nr:MAG: hypothetical protein COV07_02370 [Candidatus Vogelbacteria bacterium CG10_big_fil_rev_8_21_14_0_10_45_14]
MMEILRAQPIILAGGKGTRMKSELPKVMHSVNGEPMIGHVVRAVSEAGFTKSPVVVVCHGEQLVRDYLGDGVRYVRQSEPLGTGHAVLATRELVKNQGEPLVVLCGDMPLVREATLRAIVSAREAHDSAISMGVIKVPDFEDWRKSFYSFGRVMYDKDGNVQKITELKDASDEERKMTNLNPSFYCFKPAFLWEHIAKIEANNAQGEILLTDIIKIARDNGEKIVSVPVPPEEALGVNTKEDILIVEKFLLAQPRLGKM